MAKFYHAMKVDWMVDNELKNLNYEASIIESVKMDQKILLVKLVFWYAGVMNDEQISNICYSIIKELKFKQIIPDSELK